MGAAERDHGAGALAWIGPAGEVLAAQHRPDLADLAARLFGNVTAEAHRQWCKQPEPRPTHPAAPLVRSWQRLAPVTVDPETRADRRIVPTVRVGGPTRERERGRLFGAARAGRP